MAASFTDAEISLGQFLKTIPGVTNIAWTNVPYTPPTNALWVRPTLLSAQPSLLTYGNSPTFQDNAVLKISLFGPLSQGIAPVSRLADAIVAAFRTTRNIQSNGINIQIENAGRSDSLPNTQYFQMSVNVSISFIF